MNGIKEGTNLKILKDLEDIDIETLKKDLKKIFSWWDFSKVFNSKIIDDIIFYITLIIHDSWELYNENLDKNTWSLSVDANDIHDIMILISWIRNDILNNMEVDTFHKIDFNIKNYMDPDWFILWKDRIFRITDLLIDILRKINNKHILIRHCIGDIFINFIWNYLLAVYLKASDTQKIGIKNFFTNFEDVINLTEIINIYDNLFNKLNIKRGDFHYNKDKLEKLFYYKILTKDFKKEFKEYEITLYNWNEKFDSFVGWKILFKETNDEINFKIILWGLELVIDNGIKLSSLLNEKDYNILKNDILEFYLEALEASDNPSNEILEKNKFIISKEDLEYIANYVKGNVDNIISEKKNEINDNSYKEALERIKSKSSKELIKAFKKLTKLKWITWSHHIFENKEANSTFPIPLSKWILPIWTLYSIIRLCWFSVFEINEKL